MSRLIETIRCDDGIYFNLTYHEQRRMRAWKDLYHSAPADSLEQLLRNVQPPGAGRYRCRVLYDNNGSSVEFSLHQPRIIESLKLVYDDAISYLHKFEDRSQLDKDFEQRGECDDVLIVKNGMVTDSWQANIVFRKGGEWFTPLPGLLKGTMRESLLDEGRIQEREIYVDEIREFDAFRLINALRPFDEVPEVSIRKIVF